MAEPDTRRIAHDLLGEPHIDGRRVSVRQVYELVEQQGELPEGVADRFDLDIAAVYDALAYYHDHPREMATVQKERKKAITMAKETVERPENVEKSEY